MYSSRPSFRYWILGLFLLSVLMPVAHAEHHDTVESHSMMQSMDCHEETTQQKQLSHDACAESCDCAATGCHIHAALAHSNPVPNPAFSGDILPFGNEKIVRQFPRQLEHPPRS